MATILNHKDLTIELFDDPAYTAGPDSPTAYDKIIEADEDKEYSPVSQHAIKISRGDALIYRAIVLASGGGTGVHSDSAIIDEDNLIIRCCNKLFSLSLPGLEINWVVKPDWATCFSIHRYKDTFITHGEMSVSRIDKNGNILWLYSGADIFVCLYEGTPFEMHDTYIALTDFNGSTYKIDYDGNTIEFKESNQQLNTVIYSFRKPWWKFW